MVVDCEANEEKESEPHVMRCAIQIETREGEQKKKAAKNAIDARKREYGQVG